MALPVGVGEGLLLARRLYPLPPQLSLLAKPLKRAAQRRERNVVPLILQLSLVCSACFSSFFAFLNVSPPASMRGYAIMSFSPSTDRSARITSATSVFGPCSTSANAAWRPRPTCRRTLRSERLTGGPFGV